MATKYDADRTLIEMVKNRPHLYDSSWKDYKAVEETSSSWKTIGQVLGCDWKECKERWRKLRDSYVKQKKALVRCRNNNSEKKPKWRYFEDMEFLSAHVRHRKSDSIGMSEVPDGYHKSENSLYFFKKSPRYDDDCDTMSRNDMQSPYDDTINDKHDILVDDPSEREKCAQKFMETILSQRLKKKQNDTDDNHNSAGSDTQSSIEDQQMTVEPISNPKSNFTSSDDEESLFGMMVASTLRRFPPRLRSLAKMRINTIIYEIEEHQYQIAVENFQTQNGVRSMIRDPSS